MKTLHATGADHVLSYAHVIIELDSWISCLWPSSAGPSLAAKKLSARSFEWVPCAGTGGRGRQEILAYSIGTEGEGLGVEGGSEDLGLEVGCKGYEQSIEEEYGCGGRQWKELRRVRFPSIPSPINRCMHHLCHLVGSAPNRLTATPLDVLDSLRCMVLSFTIGGTSIRPIIDSYLDAMNPDGFLKSLSCNRSSPR